jgi:hypothetical protein
VLDGQRLCVLYKLGAHHPQLWALSRESTIRKTLTARMVRYHIPWKYDGSCFRPGICFRSQIIWTMMLWVVALLRLVSHLHDNFLDWWPGTRALIDLSDWWPRYSGNQQTTRLHQELRLRCRMPFIGILDACVVSHLYDVYLKVKSNLSISMENYLADSEQTTVCTISRYRATRFYYLEPLCHSTVLSHVT